MANRTRKVQLKFWVTEEERAIIERKMEILKTKNMGAYLRKMAIDVFTASNSLSISTANSLRRSFLLLPAAKQIPN